MNRFRYILMGFFFLLVVLQAHPAEGSVAQVRLQAEKVMEVGPVALGMIADVAAEDSELEQRLKSLIVGQVVEGTTQSSVGVYEITRSLALAHILPASVDIYGATRCRLEVLRGGIIEEVEHQDALDRQMEDEAKAKKDETVDSVETIRNQLIQLVVRQSGLDASCLKMEWRGRDVKALLDRAFAAERYRIKPRSTMAPGNVMIEVIDREGNGPGKPKIFRVKGQVSYLCESVVATRPLKPGDVIGRDDVKMLSRRVDNLRDLGIEGVGLVVGQEAARSIPMNMVLQENMIKKVELIRRNDVVNVQYNDGRIVLSLQARAEQSGCLGDVIKVYDLFNKRSFQGQIIGAGQVRVLHGGGVG